ncbi:MAG: DUF3316 domain-containing protein [Paludibacter sp.]|nr:DUF3316 domain-containing protein [Paludibacter sp.]
MRKTLLLILILLYFTTIHSQSKMDDVYILTNKQNTLGLSSTNITDPYLSPIQYSGLNLQFDTENYRFLKADNLNLSRQNKLSINGGLALNPASTSMMMMTGINYIYGLHYHLRPINNLTIMAGGSWDADIALKYVARNSNNPVSTDISTNLNISGIAFYKFNILRRNALVQLSVQSPLLGYMFVPRIGSSYYELFLLGNMDDAFHFSSLHNKRGIDSKLIIQFPFKRSKWHIGIGYKEIKYSANETVYKNENFSFLIGTSLDMITFAGRKNKAPINFKNIYE